MSALTNSNYLMAATTAAIKRPASRTLEINQDKRRDGIRSMHVACFVFDLRHFVILSLASFLRSKSQKDALHLLRKKNAQKMNHLEVNLRVQW